MEKSGAERNRTENGGSTLLNVADLVDNDTQLNLKCIHCKRCGSKLVRDAVATLLEDRKISMPSMHKKHEGSDKQEESDTFWMLKNLMEFENVGVTHTVDSIKYLCCADCEVGPVGLTLVDKNDEYLVAADRVEYR